LFADDTNVLYPGKIITDVNNVLNNELKQMSHWLKVNKLSLNINKTNYKCFYNKLYVDDREFSNDGLDVSRVQVPRSIGR